MKTHKPDTRSPNPLWTDALVVVIAFIIAIAFVLLMTHSTAKAQWGPRGCSGQSASVPTFTPYVEHFHWQEAGPGDEGRIYLYRNGIQIGGWDLAGAFYRPYDARRNTWGDKRPEPPYPLPALSEKLEKGAPLPDWATNGIEVPLPLKKHSFSINGKEVSEKQAFNQLKLEDDSDRLWLVLIGSEESRKKVLTDLEGEPKYTEFRKRVRVWSVPPDHFSLMDRETGKPMFENAGNPSIYLLQPGGEELFQKNGYVASDLEDIRKADPLAKKPEDPKKKDDKALPTSQGVPGWVLLSGLGVLAFVMLVKGKK